MNDIYFDVNYAKVNEYLENGKALNFSVTCEYGRVSNLFILREIPVKLCGETFYDITTPYGYGGPIIEKVNYEQKSLLLDTYEKEFAKFCYEKKIVSEFVRFHPIINNANDFNKIYNVSFNRKTLGTDLKSYDDPVMSEFSKSCRKKIRKALNKGISYEVIESPESIGEFKDIYYSTMDRNNASQYYYFGEEYFDNLLLNFKKNIVLVKATYKGATISQGLYFVYGGYIHIHLSGTLSQYLELYPAYILRYAVTRWGKEKGYELIHHGGGRSSSSEDGLYEFKKRFSQNTEFDFYIGKKVWDKTNYNKICSIVNVKKNQDYFPAYRL
ncbi:GNAT family N-acetyltransferase [Alkalibacillus haloalkaliphilus]|uniref:GNAT family N-acetyltransferase n=1 Tax=Alkalibacillus haloalkaliphilus TaxID=94136 RepID=UPI0002F87771|nr:GNAT family N-acetyltransferase [Alkalibacillus haloalkaliphilus]